MSEKRLADPQPPHSARAAGLRYVNDLGPGIERQRAGKGFRYVGPDRRPIRAEAPLARIRALAIPPAWRDVWICPLENGHLQATGRDAKGRKQYRYHPRWREVRDENKYGRLRAFAAALPRLRRRVSRDLRRPGLPREKVIATVVRLLEVTFMRVGNEQYARENDSFGLTTLREHQVRVQGTRLRFRFRGKSGVQHSIELTDGFLATIVRRMQELPGEELFRYVDDQGATRSLESADVNAYLREAMGEGFTSKDFRTWAGTVLVIEALRKLGQAASLKEANGNVVRAVEQVAARLGNTKAVCRKSYIHPAVIDRYLDGSFCALVRERSAEAALPTLLAAKPRPLRGLLKESLRGRRAAARSARAGTAGRDPEAAHPGAAAQV